MRRIFRHYGQFRGLSEQEVNARLREQADEIKRQALARVEVLDLSRTTWPEVPHADIVGAITFAARRGLHRYADRAAADLRAELAARHDLPAGRVAVGNGATQLLEAAIGALLEPGDELITPWPSYPLYPVAARRARGVAVPVRADGPAAILEALTPATRVVCLCNPNDPTGTLLGVPALRELLDALPERVVVLVDEALRDFAAAEDPEATRPLLDDHPRLLLFRTFSKAWGLAGLRCGYVLGGAGAEELLERLGPELGIDDLAQAGCLEALRHHAGLPARRRARLAPVRERLAAGLAARGLHVTGTDANVLWVPAPDGAGAALAAALERQSILVAAGDALGEPGRVRITVPVVAADADRLLRALDLAAGDGAADL
ncbi:MAG TPA: histidinol-phosphate transaminase [Baekduia sp.]|nr:histidinol-phosphate transaminase [Baekduia sp.]